MLVASAVKMSNGSIFVGKRHGDCFKNYRDIMMSSGNNWTEDLLKANSIGNVQGFITDDLRFLTREEALEHARAFHQVGDGAILELFSEDLW